MAFPFETLFVYRKSLAWVARSEEICLVARRQIGTDVLDQLRRASVSVVLNIAEGAGKTGADRQRFFRIARGSVYECVPIVQILRYRSILKIPEYEAAYNLLEELGKMLTTLSKASP